MRRDLAYLEDIVEASDAIAEFIRDQDMESFLSSPMFKSALAHQFTVIGEAAARVAGGRKTKPGDRRNVFQFLGKFSRLWTEATKPKELRSRDLSGNRKTFRLSPGFPPGFPPGFQRRRPRFRNLRRKPRR